MTFSKDKKNKMCDSNYTINSKLYLFNLKLLKGCKCTSKNIII